VLQLHVSRRPTGAATNGCAAIMAHPRFIRAVVDFL
jgi:hypothetical protein